MVPIVAVTANSAEPREETYRKAGIGWHLSKPFTCDALLSMVDTVAADSGRGAMTVTHLAPVPVGEPLPVLDEAVLGQLASRMSADNIEAYLRTLLGRVDDLLALLAGPDAAGLAELVHEMQGSVGLLGFTALGARLHEYEAAGGSSAAALLDVAEQTRAVLHQRLSVLGLDSNAVAITP
jgi:CheY-like chemotaxis protein